MRKAEDNLIEIQEDVRIPGTDIILEKGDRIRVVEALPIDGYSKGVDLRTFSERQVFDYDDWEMVQHVAGRIMGNVISSVRGGEREAIKDYVREYLETTANGMRIGDIISAMAEDIHQFILTGWFN